MSITSTIKTVFLLTALTVLLVLLGGALGGVAGLIIAFAIALAMNFIAYWFSDSIALTMAGAKPVSEEDAPQLHQLVEELALLARVPKPKVYRIESDSPNAFATGRDPNHAAIAVTTGIMRLLNREELKGVLSHELSHVRNRDTLVMTIVATLAGAITMLAQMGQWALIFGGFGRDRDDRDGGGLAGLIVGLIMIILAPIAAMLIQLAISRAREYGADETGARILGDPLPLASALEKLEKGVQQKPLDVNPAASHLFIVNPLKGEWVASLFSTHPPIKDRVDRLRRLIITLR
ncbi:MAG: zinc metalloprotease HtpX [Chloroflexi bacterium]|nr:zinc metalloprotease HtpX [Chloroflexota bacterium]